MKDKINLQERLTKVQCTADNNYVTNLTCKHTLGSKSKLGNLELKLNISKQIDELTMGFHQMYKIGNKYNPYLINVNLSLCDILKHGGFLDSFSKAFYGIISKISDKSYLHPCPIKVGPVTYKIDIGFVYNKMIDSFKFLLPSGSYLYDVYIGNAGHIYVRLKFYLETDGFKG